MSTPLGLSSSFGLLPVTGSFALPLTAYYGLLSARVISCRIKDRISLGDGSSSSTTTTTSKSDESESESSPSPLLVAIRSQANFVEYVPWAIMLSAFAELNGANKGVLNVALASLLAFRVMHTELGLRRPGALGRGRLAGFLGTMGVIGFLSTYSAYLVRGYWGF